MQAFLVTSLVTHYFTIAETGGGGSLGCPLADVYIHQVPSEKHITYSIFDNPCLRRCLIKNSVMYRFYLLVLIGLLVTPFAYSKSYNLLGSNGRSAEFSGFLYSDSSGIFSRLKNGITMNIPWSKIDKSMYGDPDDLLFQPHYLKDKDTPTALSWGFYSSPNWDDKTLKYKNSIFRTSDGNHALIMADEFNKYGILWILTSNSWDLPGISSGPIDPFAAAGSRITANADNLIIMTKLEELNISTDFNSLASLQWEKVRLSDSFFIHLIFREEHANFELITHGDDAISPTKTSPPKVSIAEFSQLKILVKTDF